jgi:hypothetical protein
MKLDVALRRSHVQAQWHYETRRVLALAATQF